MNFKRWLAEYDDKGFTYYKDMVLGKLGLDPTHGLFQDLNAWEPEQLISILNGLGEFMSLSSDVQGRAIELIKSGTGNLKDLVQLMSEPPHHSTVRNSR